MTNNKQQTAVDIDLLYAKVRHASDYVDYIKNRLYANGIYHFTDTIEWQNANDKYERLYDEFEKQKHLNAD